MSNDVPHSYEEYREYIEVIAESITEECEVADISHDVVHDHIDGSRLTTMTGHAIQALYWSDSQPDMRWRHYVQMSDPWTAFIYAMASDVVWQDVVDYLARNTEVEL